MTEPKILIFWYAKILTQALQHDSHIWFWRFPYILVCSGPWCGVPIWPLVFGLGTDFFWIQYRTFCEFNHFFLKGGAFLYQLFYMICSIENNVWKKTRVNMILFWYLVIYLHILTFLVLFYTGIMLLHCH